MGHHPSTEANFLGLPSQMFGGAGTQQGQLEGPFVAHFYAQQCRACQAPSIWGPQQVCPAAAIPVSVPVRRMPPEQTPALLPLPVPSPYFTDMLKSEFMQGNF